MAISSVLGQVPETFMNMLSREKDNLGENFLLSFHFQLCGGGRRCRCCIVLRISGSLLVKMFPDLFAQMRSQSTLIPASETEVITNADGSTTTRVRSSKSYRLVRGVLTEAEAMNFMYSYH